MINLIKFLIFGHLCEWEQVRLDTYCVILRCKKCGYHKCKDFF